MLTLAPATKLKNEMELLRGPFMPSMTRKFWFTVAATIGCLIQSEHLCAQFPGSTNGVAEAKAAQSGSAASAESAASPASEISGQGCTGTDEPRLSCDALSAQAGIDQARAARVQIIIGCVQAVGLVLSLGFSALAAWAAFRAVDKAGETLDETKNMNAAAVRPHISIEVVEIEFDIANNEPTVKLATRNAGSFAAQDWEYQALLKYRVMGNPEERKSIVTQWGSRGVAGVNLAPGDESWRIPKHTNFALNLAEQAAILALQISEGLLITLVIFSRCFDVFGNQVLEQHHFRVTIFNAMPEYGNVGFRMQRTPRGTQIEGHADEIPCG